MKKFNLRFLQIAWVAEVIALVAYSMVIVPFMDTDRVALWYQILPALGALIGAQGAAGSVGPLMADKIKNEGVKNV